MSSSSARLAGHQGPSASARPLDRAGRSVRRDSTSILIPVFILSLALPIILHAGPLRLSPYRLFLLILFIPCVMAWLSGRIGRIRLPDILVLLSAGWGMLAFTVNHGVAVTWEASGILLIETFGAYLLARWLIRSRNDFRAMVRTAFWLICALAPFAAIEAFMNRALLLELLSGIATTVSKNNPDPRLGFHRAQVVFEHSILYGIFCASAFGLVYYTSLHSRLTRLLRASIVVVAAVFSLTAGAIATLLVQFVVSGWDQVTARLRNRWLLLATGFVAAYIFVDLLSNRTPFHVIITYLTFSAETGYVRIIIWNYGTAEVMRNPVFGIGLGDWARPSWMGDSVDNFWLLFAMRYGLPAFVLLAGAVALVMKSHGRVVVADDETRAYRTGLLVTLAGLIIGACTVHYWNALFAWFMFLVGSGTWMLDEADKARVPTRPGAAMNKKAAAGRRRRPAGRLASHRLLQSSASVAGNSAPAKNSSA